MLLWFVGLSVVATWAVFRDPALDIRVVVAGALLPDVVDGLAGVVAGGAPVAHTLLASAVLLAAVMAATRGRRHLRRRLVALPIGTFLHLVLDGVWAEPRLLWWPALGAAFDGGLPSLDRPAAALLVQEVVGLGALVWAWRSFGLSDPARRHALARRGRLEPAG